jgi:protein gp37
MGDRTKISWTDATWAPARGCSRISEGCRNCYAERMAARFSGPGQAFEGFATAIATAIAPRDSLDRVGGRRAGWTRKVEFQPDQLAVPLGWRKPRRIFVSSMTDIFHESLTNEQIAAVFGVMAACPQHTFQVLTKRARRMREWFAWVEKRAQDGARMFPHDERAWRVWQMLHVEARKAGADLAPHHGGQWPLPNVWLGVSVENQAAADERIPELLQTPAAIRFLSCEPLIGEVDLDRPRCDGRHCGPEQWGVDDDGDTPWCSEHDQELSYGHWLHLDGGIDWVIAGCESGPGARPCDFAWLRSLRDQCAAAEVPFFLKQATPWDEGRDRVVPWGIGLGPGSKHKAGGVIELPYLDGIQHAAFPKSE